MSFFSGLADKLTGGLAGRVMDTVEKYFPPDLSPTDKANLQHAVQQLEAQERRAAEAVEAAGEERFNARIKQMEGTAADLRTMPILGPLVIFLRGTQRPVWGFATLAMDWHWFTSSGTNFSEQQGTALIVINTLVLGFLFGERAVKNVMPLIVKVWSKT